MVERFLRELRRRRVPQVAAFYLAMEGFNAALAVDSGLGPALAHYPLIAAMRRDTAALNRYRRLRRVTGERERTEDSWLRAVGFGDEAGRQRARPALDSILDNSLAMLAVVAGPGHLPLDDLRGAMDAFVNGSASAAERDFVLQEWLGFELTAGRAGELPRLARRLSPGNAIWGIVFQVWGDVFFDTEPEPGYEALTTLQRLTTQPPASQRNAFWRQAAECLMGYRGLLHGDTVGLAALVERQPPLCSQLLRATLAVHSNDPHALQQVQRLDSLALWDPADADPFRAAVDLALARLYDAINEPEAALTAARRVDGWGGYGGLTPAWLLRARLARDLGYDDEAITYYRKYLDLMSEADSGSTAEVNVGKARRELAELVSEG